jgi:hypothetical protein
VAYAWMPGTSRIRAELDGGPLGGGAPRAVWLTLGTAGGTVSVQSAAQRLISERRPCHLVWDPVTGGIAQLVSVLRAGRALGAAEHLGWAPGHVRPHPDSVNAEGRVCVQIGVLGLADDPFTGGTLAGIDKIMAWLDSWGIPRRWPAGRPEVYRTAGAPAPRAHRSASAGPPDSAAPSEPEVPRSRAQWARGGHFGASQVPDCDNAGPGAIDIDRITGPHCLPGRSRSLSVPRSEALAIPALRPSPAFRPSLRGLSLPPRRVS